ncbi:MAG: hypothetical protein HYY06_21360 [Deltaproteobacteria bacterium]|nr:hypothetical protein [Deltaproteobacteria bacterium]
MRVRPSSLCPVALAICAGCAEPPKQAAPRQTRPSAGLLDALGRRMNVLSRTLAERGYAPASDRGGRSFLPDGGGDVHEVRLDEGQCYTFVGLTSGSITDLRFALYDPRGAEVVRDDTVAPHALVHACPQQTGLYHFVAVATSGSGVYDYRILTSAPGLGRGFAGVFDQVSPAEPPRPSKAVADRLRTLTERLRPRGFAPTGELRHGVLRSRESGRSTLALEGGSCYAIAALSGEGVLDIDLFLYDPAGAEVARDIGTEEDPVMELCPARDASYAAEINMYEGAGQYGLALFEGPASAVPAASATDKPPAPTADGPVDVAAELERISTEMRARGYVQQAEPTVSEILAPAGQNSHPVALGPGCHAIVARGGTGVSDLDLYVFEPEGTSVDRDIAEGPIATVHICVEAGAAGLYRLDVKLYRGTGTYGFQAFDAPATVRDLGALRLRELTAPLEGTGAVVEPVSGADDLATGEAQSFSLTLAADSCYAAVAAGGDGAEDLDLFVRSPTAEMVASDTATFPTAVVRFCASTSGVYVAEVKMYSGAGSFDFRLYRTP